MADISIIGRGKSINSLIKNYINITVSLIKFLKVFELVLNQRKENEKFVKFCQNNTTTMLLITNPYEK